MYTTGFIRNRETVKPLAERLGLTPAIIDVTQRVDTKNLVNALLEEWLAKHAGGVVLWVGNQGAPNLGTNGSLEDIYRMLGGTGDPPNRYQDMTIFIVPEQGKGSPRIIRTTYGGPSSLDSVVP